MAEKIVKDSQGLAKDLVNDTISRQAAIDGFYEMASDMDYLCTVSDYVSFLESLPSAQPEIVMCKDCKKYIDYRCRDEHANLSDWRHEDDYCSYAERREVSE